MTDTNTNTGSGNGAIDNSWDDAEQSYEERLADALDGVQTEPMAGGIAIDLVTRQLLFVRRKVADSLGEYYEREGFCLKTYKTHPYLPIRADDSVFECVFAGDLDGLHTARKTYEFPRGRLAHVPVESAWTDMEIGSL